MRLGITRDGRARSPLPGILSRKTYERAPLAKHLCKRPAFLLCFLLQCPRPSKNRRDRDDSPERPRNPSATSGQGVESPAPPHLCMMSAGDRSSKTNRPPAGPTWGNSRGFRNSCQPVLVLCWQTPRKRSGQRPAFAARPPQPCPCHEPLGTKGNSTLSLFCAGVLRPSRAGGPAGSRFRVRPGGFSVAPAIDRVT